MSTWCGDGEAPDFAKEEAAIERQEFLARVATATSVEELGQIDPSTSWKHIPARDILDYYAKQESLIRQKIAELKTPEDLLAYHQVLQNSLGYWSKEIYVVFGERAREVYSQWVPSGLLRHSGIQN